jgi:hypothetical protein
MTLGASTDIRTGAPPEVFICEFISLPLLAKYKVTQTFPGAAEKKQNDLSMQPVCIPRFEPATS